MTKIALSDNEPGARYLIHGLTMLSFFDLVEDVLQASIHASDQSQERFDQSQYEQSSCSMDDFATTLAALCQEFSLDPFSLQLGVINVVESQGFEWRKVRRLPC